MVVFMVAASTVEVAMVAVTMVVAAMVGPITAAAMAITEPAQCTAITVRDRCMVARGLGRWAQVLPIVLTEPDQRWADEAGELMRRSAEDPGVILRLLMQLLPMDIGTRSEMVTRLAVILVTVTRLWVILVTASSLLRDSAAVSLGSELASVSGSASVSVLAGPAGVLSGAGPPILIHTRGGDSTRLLTTFTPIPTTRRSVGLGV